MIYRADFKIRSCSSQLISPVLFSVIVDKIYELIDTSKADEIVEKLISGDVLISDALPSVKAKDGIKRYFPTVNYPYSEEAEEKNATDKKTLKQKRSEAREKKKKSSQKRFAAIFPNGEVRYENFSMLQFKEFYRIGVGINRHTEASEEGVFFYHHEFRFSENMLFSVYIKCDDEKLIKIFDETFKVIELLGLGPDISIGKGKIWFERYNGNILTKDEQVAMLFPQNMTADDEFINISTTIFIPEVTDVFDFKRYTTFRYDSKGVYFKPPYFCAEKGSIVSPKKSNLAKLNYALRYPQNVALNSLIYTCVFPLKLEVK